MSDPFHKPLKSKSYGSIPHLPGSRLGPADHKIEQGQERICNSKTRDKHDLVTVQEKLDGSNVSVAKVNSKILALQRRGYLAESSPYAQHRLFARWVEENKDRFAFLEEGERVCGEWLAEAHGTKYKLFHDPFVAFDIMIGNTRTLVDTVIERVRPFGIVTPKVIHQGGAISIEDVLSKLEPSGHGAIDPVEGAIWRIERQGKVDFLAKFVRHEKIDGCYLPLKGGNETWNWHYDKQLIWHERQ